MIGAGAIVLAAMYMLRLISAVLHEARGSTVGDEAMDLRPGELALVVPLVGRAARALAPGRPAISNHSFAGDAADEGGPGAVQVIDDAARRLVRDLDDPRRCSARRSSRCSARCSCRARARRAFAATVAGARLPRRHRHVDLALRRQRRRPPRDRGRLLPRPLDRARAGHPLRHRPRHGAPLGRAHPRLAPRRGSARRDDHVAEFFALLLASAAGMAFFVGAANLMALFLSLEWFSIALYVMCAIDYDLEGSLEAGLKYLIIGSFGSASLLFGSALVYGATNQIGFAEHRASGRRSTGSRGDALLVARARDDHRRARLQDVGRAVPHVDAGRLRGRADAGDRVHVGGDEGRGARPRVPRDATAFPQEQHLWTWAFAGIAVASLAIGNLAALVQRNVKRMLAYSSIAQAGFMLIGLSTGSALGARALMYYLIAVLGGGVRLVRGASPRASASSASR